MPGWSAAQVFPLGFLQLPFIRWGKIEVLTLSPFQKFLANVGWTVLGKTGVHLIMFAVSIILTRYLGKGSLGDYATLLVIPVFIRLLNSFGLTNRGIKEIL